MQLDYDRFMEEGFLILPGFIEPDELHELRLGFDVLVQLSQEKSRRERTPGQPIGGRWHLGGQPRVIVDNVLTGETAYVAEYYLGRPMEVSTELLRAERVGLGQLQLMVSSVVDHGYTDWHRGYDSRSLVPLSGVQRDQVVNGPPYVQWNIALYDDDVFWVVPGSHAKPDSDELTRQLMIDPMSEVPGGYQASLRAGDAIVYASYILHWGSVYTSRMRRVIHPGYYDFDKISSSGHHPHWDMNMSFTQHLSAEARASFEQQAAWTMQCRDLYERVLKTAGARDGESFAAQIAAAHPEESCRMVSVAHFCRMAERIHGMCGSKADQLSEQERGSLEGGYGEHFWTDFRSRFSRKEADELTGPFALMTARMKADQDRSDAHYKEVYRQLNAANDRTAEELNFDSRPLRTHYHEMPDLTLEELVATW